MSGCKAEIKIRNGKKYCEVAHITPFSKTHASVIDNLIVLCPNHHKEFDLGDVQIKHRDKKIVTGTINGRNFEFTLINL